jgi:senataxin
MTLIQGPPGTGKSTTILGVLSVILNSLLKKEGVVRKDSVLLSVNQEILLDDDNRKLKNGTNENNVAYLKSHPWIYNDNSNWMDETFPIEEVINFNEYPLSKVTDNYKLLCKSVEDDVIPPEKILVCAPSNVAIDEIVRKIISFGLMDNEGNNYQPRFVRVGPNYSPSIKEYCLDYMITQRFGGKDSEVNNQITGPGRDIDNLKYEILNSVKIVCSTLSMAGSNMLTSLNQKFDTVVIDESAQAVEISTLIPLKYNCERLILVGDPKQLAATVFSRTALKFNYDQSLFKRFQEAGHDVLILKTQYRMHKTISKFISDAFYEGLLEDDQLIETNTTNEICLNSPMFKPLTYYDIESNEDFNGSSYYNEGQIKVIIELIKQLKEIYNNDSNLLVDKVSIISPYSYQVSKIKEALRYVEGLPKENGIEVNTVDGFQGKEKQIIIFSTVRSKGNSKSIGFLADERRMNVGLSRARSCLVVIGDSKKLIKDKNWEKLVKYAFKYATFYKIRGKIKEYFATFLKDDKYKNYLVQDEETFVKMIYTNTIK